MIYIKFLKSQLTGNIYPQQVNTRPFTAGDLADKLRLKLGELVPALDAGYAQKIFYQGYEP